MRSVNLGRWSRRVERYFNIKGGGGLMDVDPSMRVVLVYFSGNEDRYLEGWDRYFMQFLTTAVAAQNSGTQLRNPPGSNVVGVVERLLTFPGVTSVSNLALSQQRNVNADLTNVGVGIAMDSRSRANSTLLPSSTSNATNLANIVCQFHATDTLRFECIQTVNQEITLMPGDAIRITDSTVNEALDTSFWWRERALEQSELT